MINGLAICFKAEKKECDAVDCYHYKPHVPDVMLCETDGKRCETQCHYIDSYGGKKHDSGKPDWTLLPFDALEQVVKVLDFGAKKYSRDNWQKVEPHRERYGAALMRHYSAWQRGETNDSETGLNHLAHAACCALFLIWHDIKQKGGDR